MSINSTWDVKQFNLARDKQLTTSPLKSISSGEYNMSDVVSACKRENIRNSGFEVMIEGKAGKNSANSKKIEFNGKEAAIYLGVHDVAVWNYHTSIIIFVNENSKYYNSTRFNEVDGQYGVKYATIGAGPGWGLSGDPLKAGFNRENDQKLGIKNTLQNLNANDDWIIDRLFNNTNYYINNNQSNTDYILFPGENGEYNSNSFAHGLLNSVGIDASKPDYNLPGWNYPVTEDNFGQ